jgi:hypothetical protein
VTVSAQAAAQLLARNLDGKDDPVGVRVDRVDPRPDGTLFVQAEVGGRLAWYSCDGDQCQELQPATDPRLPLARHLDKLAAEYGTGGQAAKVEVLAYKPQRRIVVSVRGEAGDQRVLKGYRKSRLAQAARNHKLVGDCLMQSPVRVANLLKVNDTLRCLELENVRGRHLSLASRHDDNFFRLGSALRAIQSGSLAGLPNHGPEDELSVLDGLAERTLAAQVVVPPAWNEVRRRTGHALARSGDVAHCLAHRDLHDGQIHECRDGLVLFDFDLLCVADPLLDAANLIAHLKLRELQGITDADERTVKACGRALLDGLDRDAEPDFRPRLRFYQATTFLRLTLVYALRRRWAHLSHNLLELARRCVDDR